MDPRFLVRAPVGGRDFSCMFWRFLMMTSKGVEVDPHNGYESLSARAPKPARARCAHRDELVHHVPHATRGAK